MRSPKPFELEPEELAEVECYGARGDEDSAVAVLVVDKGSAHKGSDMCLQEGFDMGPLEHKSPPEQSHTESQEMLDSTPPEESGDIGSRELDMNLPEKLDRGRCEHHDMRLLEPGRASRLSTRQVLSLVDFWGW